MTTPHVTALRRIRWAVRATLTLGVAASVAANVLHAEANPVSQAIAAWPPLALLLTVELVSRVPVGRRWLGVLRVLATVAIAGIAGWVSYWHMAGVASRYGEVGASAYLLPVSVDGLIVAASISLVELVGRIRHAEESADYPSTVAGTVPVEVRVATDVVAERAPVVSFADTGPDGELIARARTVAAAHRRRTGRDITPLRAAGGAAPYSWSVVSGSLPAGLSLDTATGVLSGTPTKRGNAQFTVQVTGQATGTRSFTLNVN